MFADALLDSHHQSRHGWATLTSFGIQAIFIACLLILPLLYTQVLPTWKSVTPAAMPRLGAAPIQPAASTHSTGGVMSIFNATRLDLLLRPQVTRYGSHLESSEAPPDVTFAREGGGGGGSPDGVLNGIGDANPHVIMPRHSEGVAMQLHKSVMMEGFLIHRIDPPYPSLARMAGVQGTVVLAAVIGIDGTVQKLQVLSGHPLLVQAARDAVAQWRYRPYILNGSPIQVDTQITVKFTLSM